MYDIGDYLLIQNDTVKAVSGNTDFSDIEPLPNLITNEPCFIVEVVEIEYDTQYEGNKV